MARLFEMQAARLMGALEDTPQGQLWTQDLYGENDRWLGPVHGFAGNAIPLLHGWDWLTPTAARRRWPNLCRRHLAANAWRSEAGQIGRARSKRARPPAYVSIVTARPVW
jgi:hypothetical protein